MTAERPSSLVIWWHAIRPHTLSLSVSPVLAGLALAFAETSRLDPAVALVTLLAAIAIQVGTNLNNDAADALNGTDQADRAGPPRITQKGWASAREVFTAAHVAFALAALGGIYLVAVGGLPILAIGILSLVAGYAYSSGPWPISRSPWGEAFVITFFGLVAVAGSFYLQTGWFDLPALVFGLVIGFPAAAVLLVNNTRDRESDHLAGRQTLAIRVGPHGATRLYALLLAASFVALFPLAALGFPGALLGLLATPVALKAERCFRAARLPHDYNNCLSRTASVQMSLCAAAVIGIVILA
ncbi:1,4-dihydroxy-2-naphthoate octaprenyltransferase [Afifella pfennigii]|uniref:1,4-dihydroxy-2-naphthoate octaprenyltransferase n=1 Tax=Afifella pfennigii TaxID=209897 RepID=UPI00047A6600|nr:1,4-dihydroxy-2-naphthoate octaprenyltransferase [Afifella pfennigii]